MEQLSLELDTPVLCKLDVLETTAYARCPREYFHRYVERTVGTASGPLVVRGRLLHAVLRRWMSLDISERTDVRLLDAWRAASGEPPTDDLRESLLWWSRQPLAAATVRMSERSVEAAIAGFLVHGRLDAAVELMDRMWLVDYKLRRESLPANVRWDQAVLLATALVEHHQLLISRPITLAYVYFEERIIESITCEQPNELQTLLSEVMGRVHQLRVPEYPARPGVHCAECGARWRCDHGGLHR